MPVVRRQAKQRSWRSKAFFQRVWLDHFANLYIFCRWLPQAVYGWQAIWWQTIEGNCAALVLLVVRNNIFIAFEACLCRSGHTYSIALGSHVHFWLLYLAEPVGKPSSINGSAQSSIILAAVKSNHASQISQRYTLRTTLYQIGPWYSTQCLHLIEAG